MPLTPDDLKLSPWAVLLLFGMFGLVLLGISAAWAVAIERLRRGVPLVPARPGGPVPWGGVQVFACFALWQVLTVVASLVLRARRPEGASPNLVDAMAAVSLVNLVLILVLPRLLARWTGAVGRDFVGDARRVGRDLGLGVLATFFALPLVYGVQFLAILIWSPTTHPLQEMLLIRREPGVMLLAVVSAVLLAPAAEELLFRGIFQGWLERRFGVTRVPGPDPARDAEDAPPPARDDGRTADRIALVVPAAVFAGVHFGQWPAPIPLFVLALILGLLYRRTKSIVAPIAAHATFNGLSTLAMIVLVLLLPRAEPEVIPGPAAEPSATAPADGAGRAEADAQALRPADPADSEARVSPRSDQNVESA